MRTLKKKPKTPRTGVAPVPQIPTAPSWLPLSELRPPLPKLDSIEACVKCTRAFDEASSAEPKLEYCMKADIIVNGKTYEGEHIHRTCPFCNYIWKERTA